MARSASQILTSPVRDRQNRFSPLKITVLLGLCLPAVQLLWLASQGLLGSRPLTEAIHHTGLWAIRLLLLSLLVSPLRQICRWPQLMLVRRMVGVGALLYALVHLLLYVTDMNWKLQQVMSEILFRIYLTIGFTALLGLVALGATSTDGWIKRLGRRWQALHRLIYGITILAIIHFVLQTKLDVSEAMLMAGFFIWLMGYRLLSKGGAAPGFISMLGLAVGASFGAALLEAAWYGLATGIPFWPILIANLDTSFGWRPALWVAAAGAGMAILGSLFRQLRRPRARGRSMDPAPR